MLVLSRKEGERICIGRSVWLTVLSVRGGKVRLGIAAPDHVPIHREEVYRRIVSEPPRLTALPAASAAAAQ